MRGVETGRTSISSALDQYYHSVSIYLLTASFSLSSSPQCCVRGPSSHRASVRNTLSALSSKGYFRRATEVKDRTGTQFEPHPIRGLDTSTCSIRTGSEVERRRGEKNTNSFLCPRPVEKGQLEIVQSTFGRSLVTLFARAESSIHSAKRHPIGSIQLRL